jgi:MerR family transcriptional regulator, heat shock protein HspR
MQGQQLEQEEVMNEHKYTEIVIHNGQSISYYSEQETAEYCHMDVQMVRRLQAVGLIEGIELTEGERRYSEEDVAQLRRIRRLHHDLGINLAGIQVILHLRSRLRALQQELEQYKHGDEHKPES